MKIVARSHKPFGGEAQANFSAEGVLKYVDVGNGLATPHLGGMWLRSRSLMRNAG